MKTKKPKPIVFVDKIKIGEYLEVDMYKHYIRIHHHDGYLTGTVVVNSQTAFQLAQHIIQCALYVDEKYEKKE